MIKVNNASAEIKGSYSEIMAEVSMVVKSVFDTLSEDEDPERVKANLQRAFDMAFMTNDEFAEKLKEAKKKALMHIMEMVFDDDIPDEIKSMINEVEDKE